MTTSIHTKRTAVELSEIVSGYYMTYGSEVLSESEMNEIENYIRQYVNAHLPKETTWYPSLSEIYVEVGADIPEDLDGLIEKLTGEALEKLDDVWTEDTTAFMEAVNALLRSI